MSYQKQNYALLILKNLANAHRIKILNLIAKNKKITVNEICQELKLDQGKVSNHLAKLRSGKLVKAEQIGLNMHYSIKDQNAITVLSTLMR